MRFGGGDLPVRPVGRFLRGSDGFRWGWPGTGFDLAFRGRSAEFDLSGSRAWVDVSVDGRPPRAIDASATGGRLLLDGLPDGSHVLRLRKRTEALVGDLRLVAVELDGEAMEVPPPPAAKLEFYGDSITCGYGCLDPDPDAGFRPETESFPLSWAARTADILGAEVHAQAISGIGAVRNWPGVVGEPLPRRWRRAHPDHTAEWDLGSWVPAAVVVNLGTNDFGTAPFLPDESFLDGYAAFLEEIRRFRPGCPVISVDGPLLAPDHPLPGTRDHVRRLLDRAAERAGSLRFSLSPCDPLDGFGADHHPSAVQHGRNAREFAAFLEGVLSGPGRSSGRGREAPLPDRTSP